MAAADEHQIPVGRNGLSHPVLMQQRRSKHETSPGRDREGDRQGPHEGGGAEPEEHPVGAAGSRE